MITSSIPNKIFDYIAAKLPIIVLGENDSSNLYMKIILDGVVNLILKI